METRIPQARALVPKTEGLGCQAYTGPRGGAGQWVPPAPFGLHGPPGGSLCLTPRTVCLGCVAGNREGHLRNCLLKNAQKWPRFHQKPVHLWRDPGAHRAEASQPPSPSSMAPSPRPSLLIWFSLSSRFSPEVCSQLALQTHTCSQHPHAWLLAATPRAFPRLIRQFFPWLQGPLQRMDPFFQSGKGKGLGVVSGAGEPPGRVSV